MDALCRRTGGAVMQTKKSVFERHFPFRETDAGMVDYLVKSKKFISITFFVAPVNAIFMGELLMIDTRSRDHQFCDAAKRTELCHSVLVPNWTLVRGKWMKTGHANTVYIGTHQMKRITCVVEKFALRPRNIKIKF